MLDKIKQSMSFQSNALEMRSKRQSVISSNISNVDTPGYKAVDVNFGRALSEATGYKPPIQQGANSEQRLSISSPSTTKMIQTHAAHLNSKSSNGGEFEQNLKFRRGDTAALDGNSVNIERERANFAENTVKYEASLRSLNGRIKTLKSAMKD